MSQNSRRSQLLSYSTYTSLRILKYFGHHFLVKEELCFSEGKIQFLISHRLLAIESSVEESGPSVTPCEMEVVPLAIAEEILRGHVTSGAHHIAPNPQQHSILPSLLFVLTLL